MAWWQGGTSQCNLDRRTEQFDLMVSAGLAVAGCALISADDQAFT